MTDPIDYETDPRPFSGCLRDFGIRQNGGRITGARDAGRKALGIESAATYKNLLLDGRKTPYERTIRRLMTLIERVQ